MKSKFDELLEKLQGLNLIQTSICWEEIIPEDIWDEYFNEDYGEEAVGLDVDEHRHYETSISVVDVYGRLLGIRHISKVYSEQSCIEDCYHTVEFFEMKEVQTISYEQI